MELMNPTQCDGCGVTTPGTEPHAARCPIAPATSVETPAREPAAPAARAKPLNALTLAALPSAIRTLDDQIEYLSEAMAAPVTSRAMYDRCRAQHDDLVRSREWIQSKIDTAGREG